MEELLWRQQNRSQEAKRRQRPCQQRDHKNLKMAPVGEESEQKNCATNPGSGPSRQPATQRHLLPPLRLFFSLLLAGSFLGRLHISTDHKAPPTAGGQKSPALFLKLFNSMQLKRFARGKKK